MDWKKELESYAQINDYFLRGANMGKLEAFISTEIIEKLIDEATEKYSLWGDTTNWQKEHFKEELRNKWL